MLLCDPQNKKVVSKIVSPDGVPSYANCLTPESDMIFQDIGDIYVFDKNTAALKQRLQFQTSEHPDAESRIFMLGDSLYFFPEDPQQSDAARFDNIGHADLSEIQSNGSLLDMMLFDMNEFYQKGWIGNKGIADSLKIKLQHTQKQLD